MAEIGVNHTVVLRKVGAKETSFISKLALTRTQAIAAKKQSTMALQGSMGDSFTIPSNTQKPQVGIDLLVGIKHKITKDISISLGYHGSFKKQFQNNTLRARLQCKF
jgi:hypothetical protein